MSTYSLPKPTHICVVCGTLWKYHTDFPPHSPGSWQLAQKEMAGKCCDNVTMGDQILELKQN